VKSLRHASLALSITLALIACPVAGFAQPVRDGGHDFDFNFGTWITHIKYLNVAADGSSAWVALNGTVAVRKVWNGRALMEEIEADGATGHFEGLTLFLYNPQSRQWSQTFADGSDGALEASTIGAFAGGRGELVSQTSYQGRIVLMRDAWSNIAPNSHHFEESVSDDGGRSWQPHFIANLTRKAPDFTETAPPVDRATEPAEQRAFDFELGTWRIHGGRGTGKYSHLVASVWGGRASLAQLRADDGPAPHYLGLMLRTYDPATRQWRIYWASSATGTIDAPLIGSFANGRGEFYGRQTIGGKSVFVRLVYSDMTPASFRTEQSFSSDGGRTWVTSLSQTFTREQVSHSST
jgi:hypothetical protein